MQLTIEREEEGMGGLWWDWSKVGLGAEQSQTKVRPVRLESDQSRTWAD